MRKSKQANKLSRTMRRARKRLEAAGKIFENEKSNLFPDYPYYWQHLSYMALLDFKN